MSRVARSPFALVILGGVLSAGLVSLALAADDEGLIHRSKPGETYATLADRYYGRRYLQRHLRQLNRHAEPLTAGTPVIIPTLRKVRVQSDMSLRDFAAAHLQDPDRAEYLKTLNRRSSDKLEEGDSVLVGQSIRHVVRRGETLSSIARTYYRDVRPRRLKLLRLYNKLSSAALRSGMALRIPLDSPTYLASRVEKRAANGSSPAPADASRSRATAKKDRRPRSTRATKNKPPAKEAPSPERDEKEDLRTMAAAVLERAERQLGEGEYETALGLVVDGLTRYAQASPRQVVELYRVQAIALIALDRRREAKVVFERLVDDRAFVSTRPVQHLTQGARGLSIDRRRRRMTTVRTRPESGPRRACRAGCSSYRSNPRIRTNSTNRRPAATGDPKSGE